jgi:transcription antitermination factor NusG
MAQKDSTMHWYVARTRYFRQEIKIRDWFDAHQVESFVPTTRIRTVRKSHRKSAVIEKPLAPNLVFVRATKDNACAFITDDRLPMQYYIDCATHRMMVVPDKEMDDFRRVFDVSIEEGGLIDQPLEVGERVRVIEGPLQGVEGFVFELLGKYYVVVSLLNFLWAKAQVPRAWLQKI